MKKIWKPLVCTLIFLLLTGSGFMLLNRYFNPAGEVRDEKASFYSEAADTMDVIFCGSSSMLRAVMPTQLYSDYGIASYSLATVLQSPILTEFSVREALKYQSPQLIVLGLEWLEDDYDYDEHEAYVHSALDPYRLSGNKLRAAWKLSQSSKQQSAADYLFPVLRYHDTWHQPNAIKPLQYTLSDAKGFVGVTRSEPVTPAEDYMVCSGIEPIYQERSISIYRSIAAICSERGIPMLLVKFPRMTWTLEQHNAMAQFAQELGADFLDFNTQEQWSLTGLDTASDFCDVNHLSSTGAVKLTSVLGSYLAAHYELPDVRENTAYDSWRSCAVACEEAYAFCIHETSDAHSLSWTISAAEDAPSVVSYQWQVQRDGIELSCPTGTDTCSLTDLPAGWYLATCTLTLSDGSQRRLQTDGVTLVE